MSALQFYFTMEPGHGVAGPLIYMCVGVRLPREMTSHKRRQP
jgi:hypothetical protein